MDRTGMVFGLLTKNIQRIFEKPIKAVCPAAFFVPVSTYLNFPILYYFYYGWIQQGGSVPQV